MVCLNQKKYYKIWVIIIISIINIVILASCHSKNIGNLNENEQLGNSRNNIINEGLAAEEEGYIYIALYNGLYKMKADGSDKVKITDDLVGYINVWDNWIYYCNGYPGNGEIYKVSLDGSNRIKLNDERSYYTIVKDNWIYYSTMKFQDNGEIDYRIKKMKTDGTNQEEIVFENIRNYEIVPSSYFYLSDGWVYYKSMLDDNRLYRIREDGTDRTKVSDEIFSDIYTNSVFMIDDDWIYFVQPNDMNQLSDTKLYRMKMDGSQKELIFNFSIRSINITSNYIFYTDESDNNTLYRRNKDGSGEIKLAEYSILNINVIGDWIYCNDTDLQTKIYKISIDGKSSNEIN